MLGCRRPSIEELYANEFEQLTPDDEFLLGQGGATTTNESRFFMHNFTKDVLDHSQRDFRYESLLPIERIHTGQSYEHMV